MLTWTLRNRLRLFLHELEHAFVALKSAPKQTKEILFWVYKIIESVKNSDVSKLNLLRGLKVVQKKQSVG